MNRRQVTILSTVLRAGAVVMFCLVASSTAWGQTALHISPETVGGLETAMETCSPQGTVFLEAGTYVLEEPLVVSKPISLIGSGSGTCQVICDGELFVLSFSVEGDVSLEGITFRHTGTAMAYVVIADVDVLNVNDCGFEGAVTEIERGEISVGLETRGVTSATIQSSYASNNDGSGICIYGSGDSILQEVECVANTYDGLCVGGDATARVAASDCSGNGRSGVVAEGNASVTLESMTCSGNAWHGIAIVGQGTVQAEENECIANGGYGIVVVEQAAPTLHSNICRQNVYSGIAYFGSAIGIAADNECVGNEMHGIYVGEQTAPILESNTCQDNTWSGITYAGTAVGTAIGNQCLENGWSGIYVDEQAAPTLESNTCEENLDSGIAYFDSAAGTATG
ncbi:right-handed parallel beta-helix repeat-containing protein, partial [Candidatus Bipolaricaulota bacterium]|nr:right-handed parallel beta-helix repeat-containing protein [Candidatus Bipolaricaulota bacterium]